MRHSTAFLDRPTGTAGGEQCPHGPYWRAARRNVVAGVLQPSRVRGLHDTRARARAARELKSGAPVRESLALRCVPHRNRDVLRQGRRLGRAYIKRRASSGPQKSNPTVTRYPAVELVDVVEEYLGNTHSCKRV